MVERADREHPEGNVSPQDGRGDGVDGAVTSRRDGDAASRLDRRTRLIGHRAARARGQNRR